MLSWSSLREAEEALADGGDLEKDQLGRVTLLGFIRWCRQREKRRLEAEARRHNPPPPWKERLKHWRKVTKKDAKRHKNVLQVCFHAYLLSRLWFAHCPAPACSTWALFTNSRRIPARFLCYDVAYCWCALRMGPHASSVLLCLGSVFYSFMALTTMYGRLSLNTSERLGACAPNVGDI